MEFLDELENGQRDINTLQQLRQKKALLQEQLKALQNEQTNYRNADVSNNFDDIEVDATKDEQKLVSMNAISESYRLLGISIHSMDSDLVVRFDTAYRNQHVATDSYCMQLVKKGDNFTIGQHNLPPFIPDKQLEEKFLNDDDKGFGDLIEHVNNYLRAYIQRREGFKHIQDLYKSQISGSPNVNICVTYCTLRLLVDGIPPVDVILQYSLLRCHPDSVDIKLDTEGEVTGRQKTRQDKMASKLQESFMNNDIYTAFNDIFGEMDT